MVDVKKATNEQARLCNEIRWGIEGMFSQLNSKNPRFSNGQTFTIHWCIEVDEACRQKMLKDIEEHDGDTRNPFIQISPRDKGEYVEVMLYVFKEGFDFVKNFMKKSFQIDADISARTFFEMMRAEDSQNGSSLDGPLSMVFSN